MTEVLRFTVPGEPKPWARPRFNRSSGMVFTSAKARAAGDTLAARVVALVPARDLLIGPIELAVLFVLPVPASWPQWQKAAAVAGTWRAASKPDVDNLLKILKDSLNGLVWRDDAQVDRADAAKVYGDIPRTIVTITPLDQAVRPPAPPPKPRKAKAAGTRLTT